MADLKAMVQQMMDEGADEATIRQVVQHFSAPPPSQRDQDYEALQQRMNVDAGVGPGAGKANAVAAGLVGAGLGTAAIGPGAIAAGVGRLIAHPLTSSALGAYGGYQQGGILGGMAGAVLGPRTGRAAGLGRLGRALQGARGVGAGAAEVAAPGAAQVAAGPALRSLPETAAESVDYLKSLRPSTLNVPEQLTPWKLRELRHLGQAGRDAVLRALGQ